MSHPPSEHHPAHLLETPPLARPAMPHTPWGRVFALGLAAAAIIVVVMLAFTWPTVTSQVRNLPIAVTGPSAEVTALKDNLATHAHNTFAITTVSDQAAAEHAIRTRQVDGAIVLSTQPVVIVASAAGTAPKAILTGVAGQLQAEVNAQAQAALHAAIVAGHAPAGATVPTISVRVVDLVPLASGDTQGAGLVAASFPLVIGGVLGGVLISLLVVGDWRRVTAVLFHGIVGGFVIAGVLQGWFHVVQGTYLLNVAAVATSMIATAFLVVGTNALIGRTGIAVGAVITMLVGNPISAAAEPTQFLPGVWGSIGQWFVPGASVSLLRDISYFPDANSLFSWLVLAGWALLGLLLTVIGRFRNQEVTKAAA